jgi:hypothetical protein
MFWGNKIITITYNFRKSLVLKLLHHRNELACQNHDKAKPPVKRGRFFRIEEEVSKLKGMCSMVYYEFYWLDPKGGYQLIGFLPERRRDHERVTRESIMNWGAKFFSKDLETKDIFFIQVNIDDNTVKYFRPIPFITMWK